MAGQRHDARTRIIRALDEAGGLLRDVPDLQGLNRDEVLEALDDLITLGQVEAKVNRGDNRLLGAHDLVLTPAGASRIAELAAQPGLVSDERSVDPRTVFIVHGRDYEAKAAISSFLRAIDLRPIEWEDLVAATGSAAPYVGDAVQVAFRLAQAVVILLTPDDEARLHVDLRGESEPQYETTLTGQPRPNVLYEAGMAMATHADRTVLIEVGTIRPWSDVAGRHAIRLTGAAPALQAIALRLKNAGCPVDLSGSEWLDGGRFSSLRALTRGPGPLNSIESNPESLPIGKVLGRPSPGVSKPQLTARLLPHGDNYLLEVANRGGRTMTDIVVNIPEEAHWHLLIQVLPEYPVKELAPRDHVRIPVATSMASVSMTDVELSARVESGEEYTTTARLSTYG